MAMMRVKVVSEIPYDVIYIEGSDSKNRIEELEEKLREIDQELENARKQLKSFREKTMIVDPTKVTGREFARLLKIMKKQDVQLLLIQMRRYLSLRTKCDELYNEKRIITDSICYYSDPKYLLVEALYQEKYENKTNLTLQGMIDLITLDDSPANQSEMYEKYREKLLYDDK